MSGVNPTARRRGCPGALRPARPDTTSRESGARDGRTARTEEVDGLSVVSGVAPDEEEHALPRVQAQRPAGRLA